MEPSSPSKLSTPAPAAFSAHLSQFKAPAPTSRTRRAPSAPQAQSPPSSPTRSSPRKRKPPPNPSPPRITRPKIDTTSPFFSPSPVPPPLEPEVGGSNAFDNETGGEREEKPEMKEKKKKKAARPYADPSVYAHLEGLSDFLAPNLDVILCGINPGEYGFCMVSMVTRLTVHGLGIAGVKSAELGQHYASPTNHYYKCLVGAGFTERRLTPAEGYLLPLQYGVGSTNLVPRPSAEQSELSKSEMLSNVPHLVKKLITHRPLIVSFVGMGICDVVLTYFRDLPTPPPPSLPSSSDASLPPPSRKKPRKRAIKTAIGVQPITISFPPNSEGVKEETGDEKKRTKMYFYAVPSTSARVVAYQVEDKIRIWKDLRVEILKLKSGLEEIKVPEGTVDYRVEDLMGEGKEWAADMKPDISDRVRVAVGAEEEKEVANLEAS
ncbi:hypothetical protein P7C70_g6700, partial [Phenoliferia sp. Uapishka_3]